MSKTFTIRDTMKVQNKNYLHITYHPEKNVYYHFDPGEIREIPTKYISMTKDGSAIMIPSLEVIDTLPDLLEVDEPIENRWEILDIRRDENEKNNF